MKLVMCNVSLLATYGSSFALFWVFGAMFFALWGFFWVRVRFKHMFGTYIFTQSTSVSEVQPYLFLIRRDLGPVFYFLGPSGLFLGLGSGSKTFTGPT